MQTYRPVRVLSTDVNEIDFMGKGKAKRIGVKEDAGFEERRLIILREAARAYATEGIQNVSLDDLAKRLNVTKPALYHYVSSKDDIISRCLAIGAQEHQVALAKVHDQDATGKEKLKLLWRYYARTIAGDFGRCLALIDLNSLSKASREKHLVEQRSWLQDIIDIIDEGIDDGSIRPVNPKLLTFAVMGSFNSMPKWFDQDKALTIEDVTDSFLDIFESGIGNKAKAE